MNRQEHTIANLETSMSMGARHFVPEEFVSGVLDYYLVRLGFYILGLGQIFETNNSHWFILFEGSSLYKEKSQLSWSICEQEKIGQHSHS